MIFSYQLSTDGSSVCSCCYKCCSLRKRPSTSAPVGGHLSQWNLTETAWATFKCFPGNVLVLHCRHLQEFTCCKLLSKKKKKIYFIASRKGHWVATYLFLFLFFSIETDEALNIQMTTRANVSRMNICSCGSLLKFTSEVLERCPCSFEDHLHLKK